MFRSADSPEDDALAGRSRDQVTIDRHREYLAGLGRVGQWRSASQDADDLGGHMLDLVCSDPTCEISQPDDDVEHDEGDR